MGLDGVCITGGYPLLTVASSNFQMCRKNRGAKSTNPYFLRPSTSHALSVHFSYPYPAYTHKRLHPVTYLSPRFPYIIIAGQLEGLLVRDDVVLEFEGEDARDGGVDLAEGNLAAGDGLAHPGDHVLRIAETARAEQEVGSCFDSEDGSLGQRVGVADAAHPEGVADDDALEMKLVAQQAGDDVGRERGGQLRV